MYYDVQAESSGWLFKSPVAGGGGKVYCGGGTTGAQLVISIVAAYCIIFIQLVWYDLPSVI